MMLLKKWMSVLIVVCLVVSMVPMVSAAPSATDIITTPTGYTSAQDVVYKQVNGFTVNWGARGEDCTFLSSYAQSYYSGDYRYDSLSALKGGTSTSTAPQSDLYVALQDMMVANHTSYTTYGGSSAMDCKNFYQYTDCTRNDYSTITTLYRGLSVSGKWDSGVSYNQEHVWPKSKCLVTKEIGDIMHLRAANPNENSSRGNTAYGQSSGYYDPGVSVRGDCARIVLYIYVRWGNTANMWGTAGVMESLDVLLQWMEEDPVDTWEMGRNDAVESITGTRNVFVDYPEYAWLLFGSKIPSTVTTPSGGGNAEEIPPATEPEVTSTTAALVTDASSLRAGDQIVIAAADYDYALSNVQNSNNRGRTAVVKNATDKTLTYTDDTQVITLEAGLVNGTFAFAAGESQYLCAASSSGNYLRTTSTLTNNASWNVSIDPATGVATISAAGTYTRNQMRYNSSAGLFACYGATNSQKDVAIYRIGQAQSHTHNYNAEVTAPTCETEGYTTYTCTCGDRYIANKVAATGHRYESGKCENCGAADPDYTEPTVDYYLVGYINGSNYGCEEDWENLGRYKFVDGRLVVTFNQNSYVFVKTGDNAKWYMTYGWQGEVNSATLYSTDITGNYSDKLFVPGGVEVTFTLVENANGTLTLKYLTAHVHNYTATVTAPTCEDPGYTTYTCTCGDHYVGNEVPATGHSYADGVCTKCGAVDSSEGESDPIVAPILKGASFSLSFESEILVNFYYTVSDMSEVVEQGMLVFYTNPASADISAANDVYSGSIANGSLFVNTTKGIAAKYMGDYRYYAAYVKLTDGTYAYSPLYQYSPKKYATNMLSKDSTSAGQKALCVAMLNFGAAAQKYFGYRTDDLMNKDLTAEQQALVIPYEASLFKGAIAADSAKTANFPKNADAFSGRSATVSFEGAFAINYYFTPSKTVAREMTMYYWSPEAYATATELTTANASGSITMIASGDGSYWGQVSGIAAKYLDETYYVAGVYTDAAGNTCCTGVIAYSLSRYCINNAKDGNPMQELAANTAMYGYYADHYFGA